MSATAKQVVKDAATSASATEHLTENIERIMESTASTSAATSPHAGIESRVTVLIVGGPFLRITQSLIGLANLLKLILRTLVSGVLVRMILQRQFPVGLFEFIGTRSLLNAQDFVVVSLCHNLIGRVSWQQPRWRAGSGVP